MLSIIIPLFNESKNIKKLIGEIESSLSNLDNYEIVLVNDGSVDNTLSVIKSLDKKNIKIINNKNNKGQSSSIFDGVKYAKYETITTIDGDGQNDPADIPRLIDVYFSDEKIKLVGGIRKDRKDSFVKKISSKIANYIRSKILDDKCMDTGCSLKVFNKKIFLKFPFFNGMHRFLPALYRGYGHKTIFVNVNHRKRIYGISKYGTMNRLFAGIRDVVKVKNILKSKI